MKEDVLVSSLARSSRASTKKKPPMNSQEAILWRLEHLEAQMRKLSRFNSMQSLGKKKKRTSTR